MAQIDRRFEARVPRSEVLFLQMSVSDGAAGRQTLRCRSADLSQSGLRVHVDELIAEGTPVEVWIRLSSAARNYYLHGIVKWSHTAGDRNEIGIGVVDGESTDFDDWRNLGFV